MKDKLQQVRDALVQSATEISAETIKNNKKAIATLDSLIAEHGWQPIETAPRDGTEILITDGTYVEIGLFECRNFVVRNNGDYLDGGYGRNYRTGVKFEYLEYAVPTNWMPLPQPPTMQKEPNHDK